MVEENTAKYTDVAPTISGFILFGDVPTVEIQTAAELIPITAAHVTAVIADNRSPSEVGLDLGLTKAQVVTIRKEYQAAINYKSNGGTV